MKNFSIKKLVYSSFLIALSIILTRLLSLRFAIGGVEGIRIGFGSLPIIFGGIMLGPLAGGIIGAISDLLGYFINPIGAYMPHFTLTSFLTGFIPGIIMYYVFNKNISYFSLLVAIATGQVISSVILVPMFLDMLFGVPFKVTILPKIIGEAVNITVYTYFIKLMSRRNVIKLEIINTN
ncbi:MAG TPA: folate family ECF transporter S component [Halanaerobiales bacterium]|nr:folate family ECF transporter S component [Halanaerobiales bacterium]